MFEIVSRRVPKCQRTLSASMSWRGFLFSAVWQINLIQVVTDILYSSEWYRMVWFGVLWYCLVLFVMVLYGLLWLVIMVWYGLLWFGIVCYGLV